MELPSSLGEGSSNIERAGTDPVVFIRLESMVLCTRPSFERAQKPYCPSSISITSTSSGFLSTVLPIKKKKKSQEPLGEMADSRAGARKVPNEPGLSYYARK